MNASNVMTHNVVTISPDASILESASSESFSGSHPGPAVDAREGLELLTNRDRLAAAEIRIVVCRITSNYLASNPIAAASRPR